MCFSREDCFAGVGSSARTRVYVLASIPIVLYYHYSTLQYSTYIYIYIVYLWLPL